LRAQDPLVRRDAPDAVHQTRVAARRMRSALQAYGKIIDREATRGLTDELKWVGGELSTARDSEVIEERLTEVLTELPEELVMGPVSAQVTRAMQRSRSQGQAAALAALNSDRYLALHDAIDALLSDPPLTRRAKRPARRELPRQMGRAWRRLAKRMRAAESLDAGQERNTALHETRKAGKRLRYAAEIAGPAVGKPAKRLKRRAKTVHKLLGDHQDAVVARPVIRELAAQAHLDGGNGFTFGILHRLETNRADQAEQDLPHAWKKLRKPKNTKWLNR
jgi:CHAD domain-containing protein